jgi:hypothetical protein
VPGALIAALAVADYWLWERRGRPWHDWTVILLLLPAIFAAVWIGVGGLLLDVTRTDSGRLVYEVGPAIGLTGLLCVLISYHGRHHPSRYRSDEVVREAPDQEFLGPGGPDDPMA